MIPWIALENIQQLGEAEALSHIRPVVLFKHSTRCSVSRAVKRQLENDWQQVDESVVPYYLDLLSFREVSNAIAERTGIRHESPQFILLKDGKVVYSESHDSIEIPESILRS